ncbi:hypothetical protein FALBO_6231 [Fusarium albosuccineum]|uniref:Uncharacterized protein n=1 Tax=Fusarium albosuccineum TaxID=1237068 RepID=A0A8H4LFV1_9HYPO|nr:hypothetical protein FALBO_6231 [Fusarium albosuccineum]
MAPSNETTTQEVPTSHEEWSKQLKDARKQPGDVLDRAYSPDISRIGENELRSASKLKYEDWLLLKVIWKPSNKHPTHNTFFSSQGPRLRAQAETVMSRLPWMKALKDEEKSPLNWSYMAPWKMSTTDINKRMPADLDLAQGRVYDDADPFRLVIEPSNARGRPRRAVNPDHAQRRADMEATYKRLHDALDRDQPAVSSQPRPHKSPSPQRVIIQLHGLRPAVPLGERLEAGLRDSYSWSILHRQLSVSHPGTESDKRVKILTAKTDGCLTSTIPGEDPDRGDTLVIIEVKPYRRDKPLTNATAVRIQEGAEMAAWISTESMRGLLPGESQKRTYRRLLISQDFDEIYLTIAEFDDLYVQYIRGGDKTSWPVSVTPPETPSKAPRSDSTATREERGRSSTKETTSKPSSKFPNLFRSSSSSRSSTQPAASAAPTARAPAAGGVNAPSTPLPTRSRQTTPLGSVAKPPIAPPAPRQNVQPAAGNDDTGGFLYMHEYRPFLISDSTHMEELSYLLYSLTGYLCARNKEIRFPQKGS